MKTKIKKEKTLNSKDKEKTKEKTKKEKALTSEAKATALKIKNTITQANTAIKKGLLRKKIEYLARQYRLSWLKHLYRP